MFKFFKKPKETNPTSIITPTNTVFKAPSLPIPSNKTKIGKINNINNINNINSINSRTNITSINSRSNITSINSRSNTNSISNINSRSNTNSISNTKSTSNTNSISNTSNITSISTRNTSNQSSNNINSLYSPRANKSTKILNNNILIISLNENGKLFNFNSYKNIIEKINNNKPEIIIVCSQKSKSGTSQHYQHILNQILEQVYERIWKIDGTKYAILGKSNVRMRIYKSKISKLKIESFEPPKISTKCMFGQKNLKDKAAIYYKLVFSLNDKRYSFIIINTDLSDIKPSINLNCLINEFQLQKEHDNGSNIIICGDIKYIYKSNISLLRNSIHSNSNNNNKIVKTKTKILFIPSSNNGIVNNIGKQNNNNNNNKILFKDLSLLYEMIKANMNSDNNFNNMLTLTLELNSRNQINV
jgi:hypothetical protein